MRIINRDELAKMPNGTVFSLFNNYGVTGFQIITGSNGNGFDSTLDLEPSFNWDNDNAERITNWSSVDICDYDFNEDEKFVVYSKNEIREIIEWLKWAINEGGNPDMYKYFYKDQVISMEEASKYTNGQGLW
jgi:hypothetical protein